MRKGRWVLAAALICAASAQAAVEPLALIPADFNSLAGDVAACRRLACRDNDDEWHNP